MKKILSYIIALAFAAPMLTGCATDPAGMDGEGLLVFRMDFGGNTRAEVEAPENIVVKIGTTRGYTHIFDEDDVIPGELWLASGNYFIEVTGGVYEAPGFERNLCWAGRTDFTITDGDTTPVTVECAVTTTLVSFAFDESVRTLLDDYSVTLYPVKGDDATALVFDESNLDAVAYIMLASDQTEMDWVFEADYFGQPVLKTGTLTGLAPGKHYEGSFTYTEQKGGLAFTVTVDDSLDEIGHDIVVVPHLPLVEGVGFDLAEPQTPGVHTIKATATTGITGIVLSGSVFGDGYDLIAGGAEAADIYGISLTAIVNGYEITLSQAFFDALGAAGDHKVTITATDGKDREKSVDFRLATAALGEIATTDIWATHVKVGGTVAQTGEVRFAYRPVQGGEWQYASATASGDGYSAELTGLAPATSYRLAMDVDGVIASTAGTFTTAPAPQLPNGNLEEWHKNNVYYPYLPDATPFWGSGNVRAMGLINVEMTTPAEGMTPGSTAAQLQSKVSVGTFGAGNLFTGSFRLSGTTGFVNFGREFTARPSGLKVSYKATTGTVTNSKAGAPLAVGDPDQFQIQIALADSGFPHEINTSDWNTFIDYQAHTGVIAYGEIHGSVDMADWVEATIPLDYRSNTRIPTHIIVVASASRYGDYFTGSTSSVLTIDDFELIYE